jgi:hypothetical protein
VTSTNNAGSSVLIVNFDLPWPAAEERATYQFGRALARAKETAEEPVREAARALLLAHDKFLTWQRNKSKGNRPIEVFATVIGPMLEEIDRKEVRVRGALRAFAAGKITADKALVEIEACKREYEGWMTRGLPVGRDHKLPD